MKTVMTTNSGYDSVLLVNDRDEVVSAWTADKRVIADYLRDGADADNWDTDQWQGFDGEQTSISDYGTECGRNGVIEDKSRREFWIRQTV